MPPRRLPQGPPDPLFVRIPAGQVRIPDAPDNGLAVADGAGNALAPYDVVTLPIALTWDERDRARELHERFDAIYRAAERPCGDVRGTDLVRAASRHPGGPRALAAWRAYRALIAYPEAKRRALRRLLACHRDARTLVLAGDDATAYAIARELLVAPITPELGRAERARVRDRLRRGELTALVSAQSLDEDLDTPDADVAIVVGEGTSRARDHVPRIGRALRPRGGRRAAVYELVVEATSELAYAAAGGAR